MATLKRLLMLAVLTAYLGAWWALPSREVPSLIVDKTVPEGSQREHALISFLLHHNKITTDGQLPDASRYIGKKILPEHTKGIQLLFLADGYGIYHTNSSFDQYERSIATEVRQIELIEGGYSSDEVDVIEEFVENGGTVVAEFNLFGYPTYKTAAATRLESLFGLEYTGWLGRGYHTLADAPRWMKLAYEEYTGKQWDYKSPGIVLFREAVKANNWHQEVLVLTKERIAWPWVTLRSDSAGLTKGAARTVPYEYWFEVNNVKDSDSVIAWFDIGALPEARSMLERRGLPVKFPAAVARRRPDGSFKTLYFAGDFADQPFPGAFSRLLGSPYVFRALSYLPGMPSGSKFAWRWYAPVLSNIFSEEANRRSKSE